MDDLLHIWIVADDPLARAGLAMLLAERPDCVVVGQSSSGGATAVFPPDPGDEQPDVVVWDIGWEANAADLPDWTDIPYPVVALVNEASDAAPVWASGIRAVLLRQMDGNKLLAAAHAAAAGLMVLEPALADTLLVYERLEDETAVDLTPREVGVLQLLAEGLTNKAIAQQLHISNHTVKFHVNAILTKLHAQSRTEAVVRATRQGLIAL